MTDEKEKTPTTNRGFIVDLIFNFPQGVAYDRESYVNKLIEVMEDSYKSGERDYKNIHSSFKSWLDSPCKFQDNDWT